mgnify:CR=1 FL=1
MRTPRIQMDHGAGGRASQELVARTFLPALENPILKELNDSALLDFRDMRLAMSTDSYVVDPIFFPGGDIGSLAVHGTVNDLAMRGAQPYYLSAGFILEEGLELAQEAREGPALHGGEVGVLLDPADQGGELLPRRGGGEEVLLEGAEPGLQQQSLEISINFLGF